jgi:hypothetical protein
VFTKQHFEKIAKLAVNSEAETKIQFLKEMASMFKADNQKFNTEKFFLKSGLIKENKTIVQKSKEIRIKRTVRCLFGTLSVQRVLCTCCGWLPQLPGQSQQFPFGSYARQLRRMQRSLLRLQYLLVLCLM